MVRFAEGEADCCSRPYRRIRARRAAGQYHAGWRADRFGLSQLHQLRGRVGRGRQRGWIYLLTDPGAKPPATDRRLRTLEALDRVGAGFAISARDLDLRGAGDLLGDAQAGHLRLVGIELYRHLLDRALARCAGRDAARGLEPEPCPWHRRLRPARPRARGGAAGGRACPARPDASEHDLAGWRRWRMSWRTATVRHRSRCATCSP